MSPDLPLLHDGSPDLEFVSFTLDEFHTACQFINRVEGLIRDHDHLVESNDDRDPDHPSVWASPSETSGIGIAQSSYSATIMRSGIAQSRRVMLNKTHPTNPEGSWVIQFWITHRTHIPGSDCEIDTVIDRHQWALTDSIDDLANAIAQWLVTSATINTR